MRMTVLEQWLRPQWGRLRYRGGGRQRRMLGLWVHRALTLSVWAAVVPPPWVGALAVPPPAASH